MVEEQVASLLINLTAAGITAGTSASTSKAEKHLRRKKFSEELQEVATVFNSALRDAIREENARLDSKELEGVAAEWDAVADEIAAEMGSGTGDGNAERERDQIAVLFADEREAVERIAEAIATTQNFDLGRTPGLREALESALVRAYRRAIADFEQRIADSELADVFQAELGLELNGKLNDIQTRLDELETGVEDLLVQAAKNEGFARLSESFFAYGPDPKPVQCWQVGFTLTDVRAGLPAERDGTGAGRVASEELFDTLRGGTDTIVVGRPGSGKSTLCKQVAVRWFETAEGGPVLYRESGSGGRPFRSTEALKQAITATDDHVLVVVEDAVRPAAENVFEVIEALAGYDSVSFLLDARRAELESVDETSLGGSRRRQRTLATRVDRYPLDDLSEREVERTIQRFEAATDRQVPTDAATLHERVTGDSEYGVMLRLAYALPLGGSRVLDDAESASNGIKHDVEEKFRRLRNPDRDAGSSVDLSQFDADLLLDFGLLTQLLSAAGIDVRAELLHALGYAHGDSGSDLRVHDEIDDLIDAVEGWLLFRTGDEIRTPHELWSFLFLRHVATELPHRRVHRHVATCVSSVAAVFDDDDFRTRLREVFLFESDYLDRVDAEPTAQANAFTARVYALGKRYPVLAPLYGSPTVSLFDIPERCDEETAIRCRAWQGVMFIETGDTEGARKNLEDALETAETAAESVPSLRAFCLTGLAVIARNEGDLDLAADRHERALDIYVDRDDIVGQISVHAGLGLVAQDRGDFAAAERHNRLALDMLESVTDELATHSLTNAGTLHNNLGEVARLRGDIERARSQLEAGLAKKRELDDTYGASRSLWNLAELALLDGDVDGARRYAARSRYEARETGNRNAEARALACLAAVALRTPDAPVEEARDLAAESLDIAREIDTRPVIATALTRLARALRADGEDEAAADRFEEAATIYLDAGATRRALALLVAVIDVHAEETGTDLDPWCERFADALDTVDVETLDETAVGPDPSTVARTRERCEWDR